MVNILAEAKRLHALGFAVHWLRSKSKVPYFPGWTRGGRATLSDLLASYKKGMNYGVRLGHASELVEGTFLAVIDVDVKSDKPHHRKEAEKALFKLFPEVIDGPYIHSGRGNGSAHYYVRLKSPISGDECKAQSKEMVQVLMPSTPTNRAEEETLGLEDLARGVRLRKAWEVSLLSEGRQCVLAGSTHPDTGKLYEWGRPIEDVEDIPILKNVVTEASKTAKETAKPAKAGEAVKDWAFEDVDVTTLGLKQEQVDAIRDGVNVQDASAKVYELTLALLSRGVSEEKIVSIFTDKTYHLGHTAFKHARTKNRRYAATWIERYCLRKAKTKIGGTDFDFEELDQPSDEELKRERSGKPKKEKQNPDVVLWPVGFSQPPTAWEKQLELQSRGKALAPLVKAVYSNVLLILLNSCEDANFLIYDTFSLNAYYTCDTPWGKKKNEQRSAGKEDALLIKSWLHAKYEMVPSLQMVEELLESFTTQNSHHPVQEYLEALEWDGVSRIERAMKTYLGAVMPEPYLSNVSKKLFIGAVKRIFEPGSTFQYMVVLEGEQGIGKSTAIALLASKRWFLDALPNLHDKDAALYLHGTWLCEMAELAALSKSGDNPTKAFITRDTDRFRPPYGARRQDFPRSTLFIGTTNYRDYLTDPTGNRRYWPVHCEGVMLSGSDKPTIDFEALERDRDQLWAEAVSEYLWGNEKLFLSGVALKQAERIQELARTEDEIDLMVEEFRLWEQNYVKEEGKVPTNLTMSELFKGAFVLFKADRASMMRAAHALRQLGYEKMKKDYGNIWVKK